MGESTTLRHELTTWALTKLSLWHSLSGQCRKLTIIFCRTLKSKERMSMLKHMTLLDYFNSLGYGELIRDICDFLTASEAVKKLSGERERMHLRAYNCWRFPFPIRMTQSVSHANNFAKISSLPGNSKLPFRIQLAAPSPAPRRCFINCSSTRRNRDRASCSSLGAIPVQRSDSSLG